MPRYTRCTLHFCYIHFTPDYIPLSPGYTECVSISIVNDEVLESDIEQFTVSFSTADASVFIHMETADVFIFENDSKLCIEIYKTLYTCGFLISW